MSELTPPLAFSQLFVASKSINSIQLKLCWKGQKIVNIHANKYLDLNNFHQNLNNLTALKKNFESLGGVPRTKNSS